MAAAAVQLCRPLAVLPDFAAVAVAPEPAADPASISPAQPGLIEIEWAAGTRVRITGAVEAVSAAVSALAQAERRR